MSAYDKAIEAYRFQVGRYHTWMNFYSLFNGALLIAVYTLQSKGLKDLLDLQLILGGVGLIAALCWLGSIIGNRFWINSWLGIIRDIEKKEEDTCKIYSSIYLKKRQERKLLSTPVLTQIFITTVVVAWAVYIEVIATRMDQGVCAFICLIGVLGVSIGLYLKRSCIHSDISSMNLINPDNL